MRNWLLLSLAFLMPTLLAADTPPEDQPSDEPPGIEASIPEPVKALGNPAMIEFPYGVKMAVTASSKEAQDHVLQGLNHLHGGWEFEASRHFAAAMRLDPECLLAHWGMVMSLLNPSPETGPARNAATDRLLMLVEAGKGSELERGYVYGLIKYINDGPKGAAAAFRKVAKKFPNELQANVFAALFSRGGYDPTGEPTPDQEAAEALLLKLIEEHPKSPLPLNALLFIRAEAPDLSGSLELARKLTRISPSYPPYFHLLGHYEWRSGEYARAASAFGRASDFYNTWINTNNASVADCPQWIKSECYRIVSIFSKGDFETAYVSAQRVASIELPADRPSSPGSRYLMWDAKTLPARLLISRGSKGSAAQAAKSLPSPDQVEAFRKHSLAYWWIDGLRFVIEAQRLIDAGDLDGAREVVAALTLHGESMTKTQNAAIASGERSSWMRSFRALEVLASEARGRLASAGPASLRSAAYNWFASAADRQQPEPMMFPPMILNPMPNRLGEYFLTTKEPEKAVEAYQRALKAFPNHTLSLLGLKMAYQAAGDAKGVSDIESRLKELRSN
ncbi:MAG: tetratricopeptide repeat protein [Verrucomicrobiales bacterium]|nr:tetratricopeptide repeat protein [Verrucomicrobiota bacterium JB025]